MGGLLIGPIPDPTFPLTPKPSVDKAPFKLQSKGIQQIDDVLKSMKMSVRAHCGGDLVEERSFFSDCIIEYLTLYIYIYNFCLAVRILWPRKNWLILLHNIFTVLKYPSEYKPLNLSG